MERLARPKDITRMSKLVVFLAYYVGVIMYDKRVQDLLALVAGYHILSNNKKAYPFLSSGLSIMGPVLGSTL